MNESSEIDVTIFDNRSAMGCAAATRFNHEVTRVVGQRGKCRLIVGCAPSQDDFYSHLCQLATEAPDVWSKVELFHMDEYVGLQERDPRSFRTYLREHFLDHVEVERFHLIGGHEDSPTAEAARYARLLGEAPVDVIAMGIGENGHVAFNDPPVADFDDPALAKVVNIDEYCRQQQVNDGCFPNLDAVPPQAITITLPVFTTAGCLVCTVPGERKSTAVREALFGPLSTACPASMLRNHPSASLFLDADSAARLPAEFLQQHRV